MRKKFVATLIVGVAAASLLIGTAAVAVSTYRTGGVSTEQYIATNDTAVSVPGPGWQTVPATVISVNVPFGQRRLLSARFGAESLCQGSGWCSVRVVYTSGAGLIEMAPQSGVDFAFDSDGDLWAAHSIERTAAQYVGGGTYRVFVQAQRVGGATFRLDDYHLNVNAISPR